MTSSLRVGDTIEVQDICSDGLPWNVEVIKEIDGQWIITRDIYGGKKYINKSSSRIAP